MSLDLKGISDKGAAGVKQKPWMDTREAMLILRAPPHTKFLYFKFCFGN